MSIPELDTKVFTLKEIQSEIERLEAEAEAIKDTIKQAMIDRGEEVISGNGWKASWKVIESNRLDSKALKQARSHEKSLLSRKLRYLQKMRSWLRGRGNNVLQ